MKADQGGNFDFADLTVGTQFRRRYAISPAVYQGFLELFGDASPLHVDDAVAATCGFSSRLMHGAILNGFISNFVGMHFPGRRTLELGVDIRFVQPTYLHDVLDLEATVKQRLESRQVATLHFRFMRDTAIVADGVISVMLCNL